MRLIVMLAVMATNALAGEVSTRVRSRRQSLLPQDKHVVCYYANWSVYRAGTARFTPENINPYLCTHLIYAFGGLGADDKVKTFDEYQDIEKGGYSKFAALKTYNKKLKTMLAIGGWNEGSKRFSPLVGDPDRRKTFIRSAITFLRQYNFDGLDLDWEYPTFRAGGQPEDRINYAKLVIEMRAAFESEARVSGRERLLVTMAVPASLEYAGTGYDIRTLNKHLDFFNLLTYDYHSSQEPAVNHHSPLFRPSDVSEFDFRKDLNIESTVQFYLENGASREKLVLGIPTYGRSYTLVNPEAHEISSPTDGPGEKGEGTKEDGYLAYYEICERVKDAGWEVEVPYPGTMGPYAHSDNQWVGYDDEESVEEKALYVAEEDLGGIMFWTLDNDDFRGYCHDRPFALIEAAKGAMFSAQVSFQTKTSVSVSTSEDITRKRVKLNTKQLSFLVSSSSNGTVGIKRKPVTPIERPPPPTRPIAGRATTSTTPLPPTTPSSAAAFNCVSEGFFPHPSSCKKYYWCLETPNDGPAPHTFTCPQGLFFNKHTDGCDFRRNVNCEGKDDTDIEPTKPPTPVTPEPEEENIDDPKTLKELLELVKNFGGVKGLEKQIEEEEVAEKEEEERRKKISTKTRARLASILTNRNKNKEPKETPRNRIDSDSRSIQRTSPFVPKSTSRPPPRDQTTTTEKTKTGTRRNLIASLASKRRSSLSRISPRRPLNPIRSRTEPSTHAENQSEEQSPTTKKPSTTRSTPTFRSRSRSFFRDRSRARNSVNPLLRKRTRPQSSTTTTTTTTTTPPPPPTTQDPIVALTDPPEEAKIQIIGAHLEEEVTSPKPLHLGLFKPEVGTREKLRETLHEVLEIEMAERRKKEKEREDEIIPSTNAPINTVTISRNTRVNAQNARTPFAGFERKHRLNAAEATSSSRNSERFRDIEYATVERSRSTTANPSFDDSLEASSSISLTSADRKYVTIRRGSSATASPQDDLDIGVNQVLLEGSDISEEFPLEEDHTNHLVDKHHPEIHFRHLQPDLQTEESIIDSGDFDASPERSQSQELVEVIVPTTFSPPRKMMRKKVMTDELSTTHKMFLPTVNQHTTSVTSQVTVEATTQLPKRKTRLRSRGRKVVSRTDNKVKNIQPERRVRTRTRTRPTIKDGSNEEEIQSTTESQRKPIRRRRPTSQLQRSRTAVGHVDQATDRNDSNDFSRAIPRAEVPRRRKLGSSRRVVQQIQTAGSPKSKTRLRVRERSRSPTQEPVTESVTSSVTQSVEGKFATVDVVGLTDLTTVEDLHSTTEGVDTTITINNDNEEITKSEEEEIVSTSVKTEEEEDVSTLRPGTFTPKFGSAQRDKLRAKLKKIVERNKTMESQKNLDSDSIEFLLSTQEVTELPETTLPMTEETIITTATTKKTTSAFRHRFAQRPSIVRKNLQQVTRKPIVKKSTSSIPIRKTFNKKRAAKFLSRNFDRNNAVTESSVEETTLDDSLFRVGRSTVSFNNITTETPVDLLDDELNEIIEDEAQVEISTEPPVKPFLLRSGKGERAIFGNRRNRGNFLSSLINKKTKRPKKLTSVIQRKSQLSSFELPLDFDENNDAEKLSGPNVDTSTGIKSKTFVDNGIPADKSENKTDHKDILSKINAIKSKSVKKSHFKRPNFRHSKKVVSKSVTKSPPKPTTKSDSLASNESSVPTPVDIEPSPKSPSFAPTPIQPSSSPAASRRQLFFGSRGKKPSLKSLFNRRKNQTPSPTPPTSTTTEEVSSSFTPGDKIADVGVDAENGLTDSLRPSIKVSLDRSVTPAPFFPTAQPETTFSDLAIVQHFDDKTTINAQTTKSPLRDRARKLQIINIDNGNRLEDSGTVRLGGNDKDFSLEQSIFNEILEKSTPAPTRRPFVQRPLRPVSNRQRSRARAPLPPRTTTPQVDILDRFKFEPEQPVQQPRPTPPPTRQEPTRTRAPVRTTPAPVFEYEYYYDYIDDIEEAAGVGHSTDYDLVPLSNKVRILSDGAPHCLDVGVFPHPFSCKKFISCFRNPGTGIVGSVYECPAYLAFDPVGGHCNWVSEIVCSN